jgi:putative chitinase
VFPVTPGQWAYFLGGCGVAARDAATWAEAYAAECTPDRFNLGERELDDYIAEALHETAMLTATVENLTYRAPRIRELGALYGPSSRWAKAAARADELAGNPEALAEVLYGGRFGNVRPGDGWLYRGRGIPMVTFADNYARLGDLMGQDLLAVPQLLG